MHSIQKYLGTILRYRGSVVVQLAKQSLLTPEVHGSNPVIGEIYIEHCVMSTELKRLKYKKKRPGMVHFKKQYYERTLERVGNKINKAFLEQAEK